MSFSYSFLIFSGYNFRAVIAFLRFASSNSIKCYIIARDQNDPVYNTIYSNLVLIRRKDETLNLELFEEIKGLLPIGSLEKTIVLPSTEALNRFLIGNSSELQKIGFIVPLVSKSLYEMISDKETFKNICKNYDINVPTDLSENLNKFPFVAKPRHYSINNEILKPPYLIHDQDEYDRFLQTENPENYFYQEFIEGSSHYLLFYFSKSGSIESFGQENLIQQSGGRSIIAAKYSDVYLHPVAEKFKKLFQELSFTGLVMVELRKNEDVFFMIEANPRLWGPSQFFLDSGSEIFHKFCRDLGINVYSNKKLNFHKLYFWNGGTISTGIVFHGDGKFQFLNYYPSFLKSDIYLRNDSLDYYFKEIKSE
ncbi:MAG: hypothetical protein M9898_14975 [Chitinophagaceae bacterium]|nr:hypothetical protein [Chitinophagaceae bacterium]